MSIVPTDNISYVSFSYRLHTVFWDTVNVTSINMDTFLYYSWHMLYTLQREKIEHLTFI